MGVADLAAKARDELRYGVNWAATSGIPRLALNAAAKRGDLHSRLIVEGRGSREVVRERVEALREQGPVLKSAVGWVTTSHALVRQVLTSDDFVAGLPEVPGVVGRIGRATTPPILHPLRPPSLLAVEAPDHTRYRKLVTGVFTMRAVERLRDRTREIADTLLDTLEAEATGTVDLVERYCALLPVTVIAEILGVPVQDRAAVLEYGTGAAPSLDMGMPWNEWRETQRSLTEFGDWLTDHLDALRENPGDDFLSRLVRATDEQGGLDDVELRATAGLVLAAGFETTVNLLGNGVTLLTEHPDQRDVLLAGEASWGNAVEEVLRYDPPVMLTGRRAVRDTVVGDPEAGGMRVPEEGLVTVVLWGANRDPEVFEDPHRFDVTRANARDHIAFSSGRHHCLGAQLARMEGEVGLQALFERFGSLEILPGAQRRPTRILCGWESMPVRLDPVAANAWGANA